MMVAFSADGTAADEAVRVVDAFTNGISAGVADGVKAVEAESGAGVSTEKADPAMNIT
jgi:hypothetical protein